MRVLFKFILIAVLIVHFQNLYLFIFRAFVPQSDAIMHLPAKIGQ